MIKMNSALLQATRLLSRRPTSLLLRGVQMMNIHKAITAAEKGILVLIALFTVYSVCSEMYSVLSTGQITLTDLLLMFIYAEVLGMVAAFYKYNKIPITIPVFIAITALCRLIILQGKGISTIDLIYESGAVLLLAIASLVMRWQLKSPELKNDMGADE
jgi:protein PsiE